MSVFRSAPDLERVKPGDRGAAGARHHVLQSPRVLAGLEQQLRRAEDRLRGEEQRRVAVQADLHAAVGQRLDDEHDVRRAAARQARHGVEQGFVELTTRPTASKSSRATRGRPRWRASPRRWPWRRPERRGRRVGHRAHDPCAFGEARLERLDGDARGHRDDERGAAHVAPDLREHLVDDLRLHREDEDVGLAQRARGCRGSTRMP